MADNSAGEAAGSTGTIADNITSVAEATALTRQNSEEAGKLATVLNRSGAELTDLVSTFKY